MSNPLDDAMAEAARKRTALNIADKALAWLNAFVSGQTSIQITKISPEGLITETHINLKQPQTEEPI